MGRLQSTRIANQKYPQAFMQNHIEYQFFEFKIICAKTGTNRKPCQSAVAPKQTPECSSAAATHAPGTRVAWVRFSLLIPIFNHHLKIQVLLHYKFGRCIKCINIKRKNYLIITMFYDFFTVEVYYEY